MSTLWNTTVAPRARSNHPDRVPARFASVRSLVTWQVAAVTALGLLLRLLALSDKALWLDEIWSVRTAQLSWTGFAYTLVHQDPNMSAYHVLLRYWMRLGASEAALRALSVLFGIAALPLVYLLGRKVSSHFTGITASLLFAINAFSIQWSQEIRSYSMLVFLVTASSLLFLTALEKQSSIWWVLYITTSTLAVYTHLFACLVIAAHALALIRLPGGACVRRRALGALAAIAVLSLPLVDLFYLRLRQPFIPMDWISAIGPHDIVDVFHRLAGHAEMIPHKGGRLLLVAIFLLCLAAVASSWLNLSRARAPQSQWLLRFLLLWLWIPLTVLLLLSLRQPILLPRYMLLSLPPLLLIAAQGIETVNATRARAVLLLALCALNAVEIVDYVQFRRHAIGWRAATSRILSQAQPGDGAIFCVGPGRMLFTYYAQRLPSRAPLPAYLYPEVRGEQDPINLAYLPLVDDSSLTTQIRVSHRVWLVLYQDGWPAVAPVRDHLRAVLTRQLAQASEQTFGDVRVLLYVRPDPPGGL